MSGFGFDVPVLIGTLPSCSSTGDSFLIISCLAMSFPPYGLSSVEPSGRLHSFESSNVLRI